MMLQILANVDGQVAKKTPLIQETDTLRQPAISLLLSALLTRVQTNGLAPTELHKADQQLLINTR